MPKLSAQTAIGTASADDLLYIVDAPGSSPASKKITAANLATSLLALKGIVPAVTPGKTLTMTAVDNYNLTVPASMTAAGLETTNVFTAVQTRKLASTGKVRSIDMSVADAECRLWNENIASASNSNPAYLHMDNTWNFGYNCWTSAWEDITEPSFYIQMESNYNPVGALHGAEFEYHLNMFAAGGTPVIRAFQYNVARDGLWAWSKYVSDVVSFEDHNGAYSFGLHDGNVYFPLTSILYKGTAPFISEFPGAGGSTGKNLFIGQGAGNLTMSAGGGAAYLASYNAAVGADAFLHNTTGYYNMAFGYQAMYANTTGHDNVAVGALSLVANIDGYLNVGVGSQALTNNTHGYRNIAIGAALNSNVSGFNNVAIGISALGSSSVASNCVAIGDYALFSNTASENTAVGAGSLYESTGQGNAAFGRGSGKSITTGSNNTFSGYNAGNNASQKVDATNSMALGYGAFTTADNQVALGNSSVTETVLRGNLSLFGHAAAGQQTKASHNNWAALSDVVAALVAVGIFDAA